VHDLAVDHDAAIQRLEEALADHPDVTVRIAWRTVRPLARRAKRISSTVLPRVSSIAQLAVKARDALDLLFPMLPPSAYSLAVDIRSAIVAILDAQSTGARDDDTPAG
jgi:hypothetical protein